MADIGAKGGRAGAGTARRREACRRAARVRWAKVATHHAPDYHISVIGSSLLITPAPPPDLLESLRVYDRTRERGRFRGSWVDLYSCSAGGVDTHVGFLDRTVDFLRKRGATCKIAGLPAEIDQAAIASVVAPAPSHRAIIRNLLKSRIGAAAVVVQEAMLPITVALSTAMAGRKTIIVVRELDLAASMHRALVEPLQKVNRSVGMLSSLDAIDGDAVIMTTAHLQSRVIAPSEVQVLVMVDAPRKGSEWLCAVIRDYVNAVKFALLTPRNYPATQRRYLEAVFGPIGIAAECRAAVHHQNSWNVE
jgi:hypothetical protein